MVPHHIAPFKIFIGAASLALALFAVGAAASADARVDVLKAFDTAGQAPAAPLLLGADGNLYGTTSQGGAAGAGTVFQLTPAGAFTVLHEFTGGEDGGYPYAGLIQGADGNFYGTTSMGGAAAAGIIFQLTPDGALTVLYAFSGADDGGYPYAGLIQGADGSFYGTTSQGGVSGAGTIFRLTPDGALTVLYAFSGSDDGGYPYASLVQDGAGNLYGTTYQGGAAGAGTVFRLASDGTLSVVNAFTGGADGAYPYAGVILGADGNLYGTASQGGAAGLGVVFQLTPDGAQTVLHAFAGGPADGAFPVGGLLQGSDGSFFGTTLSGGAADGGTVFQGTPAGAITILYAFTGAGDGASPYASLAQAADGSLYGTTVSGGDFGGGTAFRLTTTPSLVTWSTPAPIVYGTRLSGAQLNATASVPGAFVYSPPAGTVVHAGLQTLTVSFTPADPTYPSTTSTVTLTVTQATPILTWTPPAPIVYGTPLGNAQLRARANVKGTVVYDPPAGAVVGVGAQSLSVTFLPDDAVDYATVTATVTLTVTQATPAITWYPAAMASGMALGPAQLNATASTPGTFVYDPPAGTVLPAGTQTLSVTFTPADTADYTAASASATVSVTVPGVSGGGNEYPLQFTPGAGARGLVVAGYALTADPVRGTIVVGNCSYYTVHSGSGRGGGYTTVTTYYKQTCTWDLYGKLLSTTAGAPAVPAPIAVRGTQTIYASTASGVFTGTDSALPGGGFVFTPGSHYAWLTANPYTVIPQAPYTITVTLKSDGDMPLTVSSVQAGALAGRASVSSTTCTGQIAVGATCSATVIYDPSGLRSPTGLAYDTVTVHVNADAGPIPDFAQRFTIVLTPSNTTDGD